MTQIIVLLILSIILAVLILFLVTLYSDYRFLQRENENYNQMFNEEFRLHSESLDAYEAMMREACSCWEDEEGDF